MTDHENNAPADILQDPMRAIGQAARPLNTAPALLQRAATIMTERGKQYDQPEGERSMAATIQAFNAITGQDLRESDGWLLMALLKMVRDSQRAEPHRDSCEDLIAYAALYAEARLETVRTVSQADLERDALIRKQLKCQHSQSFYSGENGFCTFCSATFPVAS